MTTTQNTNLMVNPKLCQNRAVLCNINDTLTWEGKHPTVAYQALKNLRGKDMTMRRQNHAPV